jgi:GNAT superfamily N-acetyltransferase
MNIIIEELEFATPEYDEYIAFRYKYLRQPLQLEFDVEQIEEEYTYKHFAAYHNLDGMIASLMLVPLEYDIWQMKQVAVAEHWQEKGVGSFLVRYIEQWIKANGGKKIILHARDLAMPFYSKMDYQTIGAPFNEVSIMHYHMEKILI